MSETGKRHWREVDLSPEEQDLIYGRRMEEASAPGASRQAPTSEGRWHLSSGVDLPSHLTLTPDGSNIPMLDSELRDYLNALEAERDELRDLLARRDNSVEGRWHLVHGDAGVQFCACPSGFKHEDVFGHTLEQGEARLNSLAAENAALREALRNLTNVWPGKTHFDLLDEARALLDGKEETKTYPYDGNGVYGNQ